MTTLADIVSLIANDLQGFLDGDAPMLSNPFRLRDIFPDFWQKELDI